MFSFLWPFIALFLPFPWILRRLLSPVFSDNQSKGAIKVPFFQRLEQISGAKTTLSQSNPVWAILAWFCFVLSAMRPMWLGAPIPVQDNARNIMLALDVSGSMAEEDFDLKGRPVTRLDMLKNLTDDFIQSRSGDNIGLVIFGSEAYVYAPLSPDIKTLQELNSEIGIGIAGQQTAIGEALALATQNSTSVPAESRIVILMSDGYANAGTVSVEDGLKLAQNQGVKVYTVGIGSSAKIVQDFFGMVQVNPSLDLDEKTLKEIADATGGKYFRAKTTKDLNEIFDTINKLEPVEQKEHFIRPQKELFYIPLMVGMFFFLLAIRRRV
ncbi:MAG: VWA domain-containing protein [Alphaproteobacteria bacterium]|nr:VWA domain-containing protein [Alphaproteobacteria bacterium]